MWWVTCEYTPENNRRGEKRGWLRAIKVPGFSWEFPINSDFQHFNTSAQAELILFELTRARILHI
jgi:hypothetical protein